MLTIKLQTEAAAISQTQAQGLAPLRTSATMLYTVTQDKAQTVATLHE